MKYLGNFKIIRTIYALHRNDDGIIEAYRTIGKKDSDGDIDPTDIERIITTATTTQEAIEQVKKKKSPSRVISNTDDVDSTLDLFSQACS